jgi:hypothetical protein
LFRDRLTAVALGGLVLGGSLLWSGPAGADGPGDHGPRVVFDGTGILGLTCGSEPDIESLTVPVDGLVEVVNRTGHRARLRLGGTDQGELADGDSTRVVFRHGSTTVAVDPDCAITASPAPMLVTAVPSGRPADQDFGPSEAPTPYFTAPPSFAEPPAVDAPSRQNAPSVRTLATTVPAPSTTRPKSQPSPRTATETLSSRVRDQVPLAAGSSAAAAAAPTSPLASSLPTPAAETSADQGLVADPAGSREATAETVSVLRPVQDKQPIGLLALVAAVCATGVGIGAIRALVAQRAYRAKIA